MEEEAHHPHPLQNISFVVPKTTTMEVETTTSRPLQKISILTAGSRGDVQPYLALAVELRARGYEVRFLTNAGFETLISSYGFSMAGVFPDAKELLNQNKQALKAMQTGEVFKYLPAIAKTSKQLAPNATQAIKEDLTVNRPDLLIKGPFTDFLVYAAALDKDFQIPFVDVLWVSLDHNPEHCLFGLPTLPFGLHKQMLGFLLNRFYQGQKVFEKAWAGAPLVSSKVTKAKFIQFTQNPPWPKIMMVPQIFKPILYPQLTNKTNNLHFTGYATLPGESQITTHQNADAFGGVQVQQQLEQFLANNTTTGNTTDPTVYLGWGSMISKSTQYMAEFAVRALMEANVRGIVLGGWASLHLDTLQDPILRDYAQDRVLFVQKAPHEWLFPQVDLTVHHGGSGTLAAALRAGVPTIVTPVFLDQWDHAYLVNRLQCGYGFEKKQLQQISSSQLAKAITSTLQNEATIQKAKEIGTILRNENGAKQAANQMENFWTGYVQTGQFHQVFPGNMEQMGKPWTLLFGYLVSFMFFKRG